MYRIEKVIVSSLNPPRCPNCGCKLTELRCIRTVEEESRVWIDLNGRLEREVVDVSPKSEEFYYCPECDYLLAVGSEEDAEKVLTGD